jgi:hypothetical protein
LAISNRRAVNGNAKTVLLQKNPDRSRAVPIRFLIDTRVDMQNADGKRRLAVGQGVSAAGVAAGRFTKNR